MSLYGLWVYSTLWLVSPERGVVEVVRGRGGVYQLKIELYNEDKI